jgi:predicted phage tail protein
MLKFAKGGGSKSATRTPDTLTSTDTVEVLLGISEGPIKGLADGAKSFRADDTPFENASGEANFQNFELDVYPGSELGHVITLELGGFSSPLNIGVTLAKNIPVVRSGSVAGINAIDFRVVVGQLLKSTDKGTFTNTLSLKFEIKKTTDAAWQPAWLSSPGNVPDVGTPGGGGSGGGGGTGGGGTGGVGGGGGGVVVAEFRSDPIDNGDHESWRSFGRANDILTFEGDIQAEALEAPPTAPPANPDLPAVAVANDDVYHWNSDDGTWTPDPAPVSGNFRVLNDGRRLYGGTTAPTGARPGDLWQILIIIRVWNGVAWVKPSEYQARNPPTAVNGIWTIDEKVSSPTPKDLRVFLPDAGPDDMWEYRVTKLSDDSGTENFSEVSWESVQEINRNPMAFEGVAMARVIGRASDQFTSLPQWNGDWLGRIVKVPTNYDPATRVYTGVWDGTYKIAWTDNNAWIFQDFVENTRYGLSSVFPHVVNKWKIYEWAQHCDVMVLRPDGSLRPRWTYNDYVQEPRDAKEMAQYIAGTAGARYVDDGNGVVEVIIDKDDPAIALFTIENVGEEGFSYSYTDRLTRANEITVEFVSPNLNWQNDKRIVRNDADIAIFGRIPENFVAVGCIDTDEALARARRRLIGGLTEKEMVSFPTNRKGKFLAEWNVILVGDPDMGRGMTGRIRAVTGARSVSLRDPVAFEPSVEYFASFDIVNPDYPETSSEPFRIERRRITNAPGNDQLALTFDADLPDLPEYAAFIIEAPAVLGFPKPYRITKIQDDSGTGDNIIINALELNRNKWAYIDTGEDQGEITYSTFSVGEVSPPQDPRLEVVVRQKGVSSVRILQLSWERSLSQWVRRYKVYHAIDGVPANVFEPTGLNIEVDGTVGVHTFTIIAVDIRGRESRPLSLVLNVTGESRPVFPVENLHLVGGLTATTFDDMSPKVAWDAIAPNPNFSHYTVTVLDGVTSELLRFTNVGQALEWRYDIVDHIADAGGVPRRSLTFMLAAVDQDTTTSAPTLLTVTNPAPAIPAITVEESIGGVNITLAPVADRDVAGAVIQYGPAGDPFAETKKGNQSDFFVPLPDYEPRFVRAAYYDVWSETGLNWSATYEVSRNQITGPDIDSPAPSTPIGLAVSTPAPTFDTVTGQAVTKVVFTWTANTEIDIYGYELEFTEAGGTAQVIPYPTNRAEIIIKANTGFSGRIRSVNRLGGKSGYSTPVSGTSAKDLVAPNPPTGVTATGLFGSWGLSWINATAIDLKSVEVWEHTANVFGSATKIGTVDVSPGVVGTYVRSGLAPNTLRYIWLVSVDSSGNRSVQTTAVSATTSRLATADFGPGIAPIEYADYGAPSPATANAPSLPTTGNFEGRMAANTNAADRKLYRYAGGAWTRAVAGTDLAPGSLGYAAFSDDLRPPQVVTSLPSTGNYLGRQVLLTTDKKLYRWTSATTTGTADWSKATDGADITAGSITGDRILAGTITSALIAADAITASKVRIGDTSNMYPDPLLIDPAALFGSFGGFTQTGAAISSENYALVLANAADRSTYTETFSVEAGKPYFLSFLIGLGAGTAPVGGMQVLLSWFSVGDTGVETFITNTALGTVNGAGNFQTVSGQVVAPANARRVQIVFYRYGGGTSIGYIGSPIMRRAANGELIVDGSITALKIAAGSITGDRIQAGTITAAALAAGTITALQIQAGSITGDRLTAATITALQIAANSITTSRLQVISPSLWPDTQFNEDDSFQILGGWAYNRNPAAAIWTFMGVRSGIVLSGGVRPAYTVATSRHLYNSLSAGKEHRARAKIANSTTTTEIIVRFDFYDAADVFLSSIAVAAPPNGGVPTQYEGVGTVPTNTSWYRMVVFNPNATDAPGQAWVSDVYLEERATGSLIVDGSITATKIQAGSITGDRIQAGTLTAVQIAASSITASRLALIDTTNMVADSTFVDPSSWTLNGSPAWTIVADSVAAAAMSAQRQIRSGAPSGVPHAAQYDQAFSTALIPVEPGKPLRFSTSWLHTAGFTGIMRFYIYEYNTGAAYLRGSNAGTSADRRATAAPSQENGVVQAVITPLAATAYVRWGVELQRSPSLNNAGYAFAANPRISRAVNAELIVDGTITATHIAAGTITGDRLVAGTITATQLAVGSVTAVNINVANLAAINSNLGAITAGSINIGSGKFVVATDGSVSIKSATTGQRTEIDQFGGRVYDGAGVLRVRWGIW